MICSVGSALSGVGGGEWNPGHLGFVLINNMVEMVQKYHISSSGIIRTSKTLIAIKNKHDPVEINITSHCGLYEHVERLLLTNENQNQTYKQKKKRKLSKVSILH